MSNCYKCSCSCNKMKIVKGAYVPSSVNCSKRSSFKNCKKEIIAKEELADIFLSNNEAIELLPAGTEIGVFTSGVNERGYFFLYSDFTGQNDNDKFIIKDNKLKNKQVLPYVPGGVYKVTVKYIGLRHYKQKDFDITIKSVNNNVELPEGEQIQVSSSDNSVDLTFGNIVTPGEVFFTPIISTIVEDLLVCDISTTAEFDGNITISFNNPNISPDKNPAITHLRYDEELGEVLYENVTTEVVEGKITGVVSSLSPFGIWFDLPPDAWGGAPNCGWGDMNVSWLNPFPPCPGNQTRPSFNWDSEDGILSPGGSCGCWEPSGTTIDMILTVVTTAGAIKAGICGVIGNISSLRRSIATAAQNISALDDIIATARTIIIAGRAQIDDLINQMRPFFTQKSLNDDYIAAKRILIDQADDYQTILRIEGEISDLNRANARLLEQAMPFENQRLTAAREVLQKSGELELSEANKAIEAAGLVMKRAQLDGAETTLLSRMGDLAASSIAFYGFLNQISVPKTCPGQTLNPITCECCPDCTGGKVFPNPMRGCECECPSGEEPCGDECYIPCTGDKTRNPSTCGCDCPVGKESCFSQGDENCYDPCEQGKIRAGANCDCICIPGDPCTNGKIRNTSTCGCDCPSGKEPCGDGCYDPCPPDHTRESDCSCSPYTPFMFSSEVLTIEW